MSEIEFVDELPPRPPRGGPHGKWNTIAAELSSQPGRWAKVYSAPTAEGARTRVYQLRRRYPDYEWEFRSADVYGRRP